MEAKRLERARSLTKRSQYTKSPRYLTFTG